MRDQIKADSGDSSQRRRFFRRSLDVRLGLSSEVPSKYQVPLTRQLCKCVLANLVHLT